MAWDRVIKLIIRSPLDTLILIFGVLLTLLSFNPIRIQNKEVEFAINHNPVWILLIVGVGLLILFFWRNQPVKFGGISVEREGNAHLLHVGPEHLIRVAQGLIQDTPPGEHSAVVLPANTLFDDECIRDERSSLGSFFLRHFPTGIDELQRQLRERAGIANGSPTTASPGTAVLLDKPHGTRYRVIVVAVTTVEQERGIHADTLSIVSAVKEVFKLASQSRISSLTMPIMGTGHGGLDFRAALSLLLVQSVHCMEREGGHEVHELSIVVYNPDAQKRQTIASVVNSVATIFR